MVIEFRFEKTPSGAHSILERGRAGIARVVRGGAWNNTSINSRCANRNTNEPTNVNDNIGFRVCQVARNTRHRRDCRV
ncbi:SUMF1/EgtB/PvdO family nonheme iron enzyme [Acidobacteriota bacterium]